MFLFILLSTSEWRSRILEAYHVVEPGIAIFALIYIVLIWG